VASGELDENALSVVLENLRQQVWIFGIMLIISTDGVSK
jgi:hypothetical protein